MKVQHVGPSTASSASSSTGAIPGAARLARRALGCLMVALLCSTALGASQLPSRADARTTKALAAPAPASSTVGVGLQRSTHEALGSSYAQAKLGDATGAALYSEAASRTAVTLAPTWGPEPVSEPAADAWALADEAADSLADVSVTAPVAPADGAFDASSNEPVYEEPVYEEPSYEEPAPSEPSYDYGYEEPSYEEAPAYDWYTVQASAYSVATNGGTTTASGVPLDDWSLTVASPWVPLGSVVEIEYGGMTVQATVTDRGPYVSGRDLDLTPGVIAAFGFSDIYDWGVRTVSYRVL